MPSVTHVISTPSGIGGAERVVIALARGSEAHSYRTKVLNPFARSDARTSIASELPPGVYESYPCSSASELPGMRRWLAGRIRALDPHLVHIHLFHASVAMATIGRGRETRLLTHHHGDALSREGSAWGRLLDRAAGRRVDHVVAVSNSVRSFLVDVYGYDARNISRIRNGWEGRPLPSQSGTERSERVIVCIANFRPEKGHDLLLEAFSSVAREVPTTRLILVGDGPLRGAVADTVERLSLREKVEFAGPTDDVWPFLARADLFVLASLYETLGIVVMEALAAGVPVVATAVGGIPELVTNDATGLLVPPGDAHALARAMVDLLEDPRRRREMSRAASEAAADLKMDRMVEDYFELYARLRGRDED